MERRPGNARAKFAGVLAARNESLEAMRRARKTEATFLSVDSGFGFRYHFVSLIYHNRGVAQTGSAFGSGPKGQGFKSLHPDHLENQTFQNRLEGLFFFYLFAQHTAIVRYTPTKPIRQILRTLRLLDRNKATAIPRTGTVEKQNH